MIQQTELHLAGRQLNVIAYRNADGRARYAIDIPTLTGEGVDLKKMQEVFGGLLDDIYALAYTQADGEAYCSPLIRDFEEAGKDAHRTDADGADGD